MSEIKKFYNDSAIDWAKDSENDDTMVYAITKFLSYISKDGIILDIGCGTGYETKRIKNIGYKVVGVDFSEESIKIAKEHSPDIDFIVANALENLNIGYKFDACIAIALIIHFSKSELEIFFNNIYKLLNSNGKILIVFRVGLGMDYEASNKIYKGTSYNRPVYLYSVDDILNITKEKFELFEEIESDSSQWKNILLIKKD